MKFVRLALGKTGRGISLVAVLTLVSVLGILASAMASLFINNLNLCNASNHGELAECEARAGLAEVIARLESDPELGLHSRPTFRSTITPNCTDREAYHQVTFNPSKGPVSTNNKATEDSPQGLHPVGFMKRTLPPESVHVLSEGYCRGQYRTLEALVLHPTFPYALAAEGDIISAANLSVLGCANPLATDTFDRPGHVASNGRIELTGTVKITGTARAVGTVSIPNGKADAGLVPNSSPIALPYLATSNYDIPAGVTPTVLTAAYPGVPIDFFGDVVSGYVKADEDVIFHNPVKLDNALIRTSKNVTFLQGITGSGGVVSDANITLQGASGLASDSDRLALIADGTVKVSKGGTFRGLLNSHSSLQVDNTVVIGTALSAGQVGSAPATVSLANVTAVSQPDLLAPYKIIKNKWFLGLWVRPKKRKIITIYPTGEWRFSLDTFVNAADRFRVGYCRVWSEKL